MLGSLDRRDVLRASGEEMKGAVIALAAAALAAAVVVVVYKVRRKR